MDDLLDTPGRAVTLGETMALLRAETAAPLAHVHQLAVGIGGAESNVQSHWPDSAPRQPGSGGSATTAWANGRTG